MRSRKYKSAKNGAILAAKKMSVRIIRSKKPPLALAMMFQPINIAVTPLILINVFTNPNPNSALTPLYFLMLLGVAL